jgi:hypothetical protein
MLLHAMQAIGWIGGSTLGALAIGIGPTVLFIPVLSWIPIRNRRTACMARSTAPWAGYSLSSASPTS